MTPLVDADMLVYEVSFGVQYTNDNGDVVVGSFDRVEDLLDQKLHEICEVVWADQDPILFLTGDDKLRKHTGEWDAPLNYRIDAAITKPYKGNRSQPKPFHFDNLRVYMLSILNAKVAWGMEADDLMCIEHRKDPENTVICTRDKDLRMCPGTHYGWPCGRQLGFGPKEIDELGYLELNGKGKLTGGGLKFFYAQMIMGDTVDNIPGIPRGGPALAFKLLNDCTNEGELHHKLAELYESKIGEGWRDYFKEQAKLLWMLQELSEDGSPKHFVMWDERE